MANFFIPPQNAHAEHLERFREKVSTLKNYRLWVMVNDTSYQKGICIQHLDSYYYDQIVRDEIAFRESVKTFVQGITCLHNMKSDLMYDKEGNVIGTRETLRREAEAQGVRFQPWVNYR